MQKAIVPIAILVLAFLIPAVSGMPVDETGGPFPVAGLVGILSPSNRTDSSDLLTLNAVTALVANNTENSWTEKAGMPTARFNFGLAVVNGKIYAIGGDIMQTEGNSGFSNTTDANEAYDPITDTWIEKTPIPTPVGDFGIAVYGNKIYCIGGGTIISGRTIAQGINQVYDPLTDTWETNAPMPTPRSSLDANVVDRKIYLVGGGNSNEVYDPTTDSWATRTPIPTAVYGYASAVVDNKIYIISGSPGDRLAITNLNQIYDPATDMWSSGAPIPMGVSSAAAGAIINVNAPKAIYVLGGSNATSPLNGQYVNQVYFPDNDSWSTGEPMPKDKAGLSLAVADNVLYAIGGGHNIFMPDSTDNMQYTPLGTGTPKSTSQPLPASISLSPSPSPTASPSPSLSPNTTTQPSQTVEPTPSPTQPPTWGISGTQTLFAIAAAILVAALLAATVLWKRQNKAVPVGEPCGSAGRAKGHLLIVCWMIGW